MKTILLASALAVAVIPSMVFGQGQPQADAEFVKKASVGNTFEIEESKVAEQRATDPRLKGFAQKMIQDHSDALKKLQTAAGMADAKANVTLDAPHQAMLDNLKGFNGTDFDKIYMADQIAAHAETVALLSDYAAQGQNSDLMGWTKDALPVVKQHQADINAM